MTDDERALLRAVADAMLRLLERSEDTGYSRLKEAAERVENTIRLKAAGNTFRWVVPEDPKGE